MRRHPDLLHPAIIQSGMLVTVRNDWPSGAITRDTFSAPSGGGLADAVEFDECSDDVGAFAMVSFRAQISEMFNTISAPLGSTARALTRPSMSKDPVFRFLDVVDVE